MRILNEYSAGVVAKLKTKFKAENPGLADRNIDFYISNFENKVAKHLDPKQRDILKYSFAELEKVVDATLQKIENNKRSKGNVQVEPVNTAEVDGQAVYNRDNLEVYKGDEKHKCVTYRDHLENKTQSKYGWCIARSGTGNLYYGYRYGRGNGSERIFYFVIDRDLPINDQNHAFVVHVFGNGQYGYTSALNDGDKLNLSWEDLLAKAPVLRQKNIPQNIFEPKPLTEREKQLYSETKDLVSSNESLIKHLNGDHEKLIYYIEVHGHGLPEEHQQELIDNKLYDLFNPFISQGHCVPKRIYEQLPGQTKKYYIKTLGDIIDNYKSDLIELKEALRYYDQFTKDLISQYKLIKPEDIMGWEDELPNSEEGMDEESEIVEGIVSWLKHLYYDQILRANQSNYGISAVKMYFYDQSGHFVIKAKNNYHYMLDKDGKPTTEKAPLTSARGPIHLLGYINSKQLYTDMTCAFSDIKSLDDTYAIAKTHTNEGYIVNKNTLDVTINGVDFNSFSNHPQQGFAFIASYINTKISKPLLKLKDFHAVRGVDGIYIGQTYLTENGKLIFLNINGEPDDTGITDEILQRSYGSLSYKDILDNTYRAIRDAQAPGSKQQALNEAFNRMKYLINYRIRG